RVARALCPIVHRPSPSKLPPDLDRPAGVVQRVDDAERGVVVARVAAGLAGAERPRPWPGRTGARRPGNRLLVDQRSGRRCVGSAPAHEDVSFAAALEGLRFVFRSPLIRSTMLLDFFATFFSSATALLPIFAQDILKVGADGYGWLYAAPAAGALVTSAAMVPLTERIERRGRTRLWAVAGFGGATVVFGPPRSFS